MAHRVLIAPDKFKGTLSAPEAAQAIAKGWRQARPEDALILQPISDGGDGFGSLMAEALEAKSTDCATINANGAPLNASYWITPDGTAIIESANIIGLAMLSLDQRQPLINDSTGLGRVLLHATASGARKVVVGVGGSATNDAGFGMAHAIGWEFRNRSGCLIDQWPDLIQLQSVTPPPETDLPSVTVAVDVQNPLLGPEGCTRVYGPQKGILPEDLPQAEQALERLATVMQSEHAEDASRPGAGAAGGLGFGLHCFAHATLEPGFELFANAVNLKSTISDCDWVITGEGAMDRQTAMGKGVGQLAKLAAANECRYIGLAGAIADALQLERDFTVLRGLNEITTPELAQEDAAHWLELLARRTAEEITGTEPR